MHWPIKPVWDKRILIMVTRQPPQLSWLILFHKEGWRAPVDEGPFGNITWWNWGEFSIPYEHWAGIRKEI